MLPGGSRRICIISGQIPQLDLIPAGQDLDGLDRDLSEMSYMI